MFIRVTRKVTIHRIAILLALTFAIGDGAHAVQISAGAADVSENSFSALDPVISATFTGQRFGRHVGAAAISDLVAGSIGASIRVDSPMLQPDCCSITGFSAGGVLDDDILIGGGTPGVDFGMLTITATVLGSRDASQLDTPSLSDTSWGEFDAHLLARLNASAEADGSIEADSEGIHAFARDSTLIDVTTTPNANGNGGTIELVMTVTPGDVVDFRMTGGARGWSGRPVLAYGAGELTRATLGVGLDGGLTWTSDSGVLLTPEPDAAACVLAALGVLAGLACGRRQ